MQLNTPHHNNLCDTAPFYPNKARRAPQVAIALCILSQVALTNFCYAAGRVFYDGFESGNTNVWAKEEGRNKCPVVSSASDGGAPYTGTKMLSCNWNGVVAWNDPASVEIVKLNTWSYSSEFLIRFWINADSDVFDQRANGPKYYRIGTNSVTGFGSLSFAPGSGFVQRIGLWHGDTPIEPAYWGNRPVGDGKWHKIEIYIKNHATAGVARLWEDDVLVWEAINQSTIQSGGTWTPFVISSNQSGAPGCCDHNETNHLYWDDFEIYSDTGTGATGSLADGSISTSSSGADLNAPSGLKVISP
ncbi:MAG: hypothetical protein L0Y67_04680 [Gammaproteobacteria bacterium]|nr:hypothetical protein [Gammaproteobacteria bacterium]